MLNSSATIRDDNRLVNHRDNEMRKAVVMLCLLALVGCKSEEEKRIAAGEEYVANGMKDPTSVIFKTFYKPSGENNGHLCGTLNAKNGFGAYTGANNFYVYLEFRGDKIVSSGRTVIVRDLTSKDMDNYRAICG